MENSVRGIAVGRLRSLRQICCHVPPTCRQSRGCHSADSGAASEPMISNAVSGCEAVPGKWIFRGGPMGSFVRLSGRISAAALAGAALMAAPSAALAQPTVGASQTVNVPCSTSALAAAITQANISGVATTIVLPFSCTFDIFAPATAADGLPIITGNITLAGTQNSVIRRVPFAPSFRILEVAAGGTLGVSHVAILNGITAGLGGGILNGGTLSVSQAKFSGNTAGNGGAIANSAA